MTDDLTRRLTAGDPSEATDVDALRARLADAAARDGLLDVAYAILDSPVGPLLAAATPVGLVRVAFASQGHDDALEALSRSVSPRLLAAPRRLDVVAHQLDAYFAGRRTTFDLPLDHRLSTGFRGRVQHLLRDIPYGGTRSYTELAAWAGNPRAVRAVGTACATNPLPIVVPCHRVLRSDGTLGGYAGGLDAKRLLLDLEAPG